MIVLNTETCDRLSVFCAAIAGLVSGGAVAAAALSLPGIIKSLRGETSLKKLLSDTSANIDCNVQSWAAQSQEFKPQELVSAASAIANISQKLSPEPHALMKTGRNHQRLARRIVKHAGKIAETEFSKKDRLKNGRRHLGAAQAKVNCRILHIIVVKTLGQLEGHAAFEPVLVPHFQREVFNRFDAQDAVLDAMMAKLDALGEIKTASEAGVERQAIIKLAQRINAEVHEPDQAFKELEQAVEVAISVQQEGRAGSNLDQFVADVLARVAALSAEGRNDEASRQVDAAFEQWQERQQREQLAGLKILDSGLKQDLLRRDAVAAAKRLVEKALIEFPDQTERFDRLRAVQDDWYEKGMREGLRLELEVSGELAQLNVQQAASAEQKGTALNTLASALMSLGERAGGEEGLAFLQQAVKAYDAALEVITRDTMPADWARVQMNRATALVSLGQRAGGEEGLAFLQQAVKAYDAALEVITRDAMPAQWAMVQMNRGNALGNLGERAGGEGGLAFLQQAVVGYDAALEVNTRDTMPADWAMVQMNRAVALMRLGERAGGEEGLAFLQQAVDAYDAALEVNTRDAMPAQWAMVQMNRGNALGRLGERAGGEEGLAFLQQAVDAYDAALEVNTRDTMPAQWARVQMNRAVALRNLGERAGGEEGLAFLQQAVAGYDLALEVRTRDTMPADWARVQMNRASALGNLGQRAGGEEGLAFLQQAVKACDAALEVYIRDAMPADWATVQMNRAVALRNLGERAGGEEGLAFLQQAVAGYDLALEIFGQPGMEYYAEMEKVNRQIALDALDALARMKRG